MHCIMYEALSYLTILLNPYNNPVLLSHFKDED